MAQPTPYTRQYNFTDYQTTNPSSPLPASQVEAELNAVKVTSDQTRTNLGLIQRDDGKIANQTVHKDAFDVAALALIGADGFNPRGAWVTATAYAPQDLVDYNDSTYVALSAHTSSAAFPTDAANWLLIANAAIGDVDSSVDYFVGDGSTVDFTLTYSYTSTTGIQIYVNGVLQLPTDGVVTGDYTIAGNVVTFVTAPPAPSVAGRHNVIVWGANASIQASIAEAATSESNAQGYANAAAASAAAALVSENNAASSETAAASSETAAASSETAAATSQTAAATSASAASTSATNASTSATNAANSATSASTSATNAASSATSASTSATSATTSKNAAAASATAAATSQSAAATSATSASTSASAAATSATNASNSATTAATQAANASVSASSASTSATNASNSATAAATSATNAATSATDAATSETNAATSESNAATSATNAATSESNAATSATAAASSATAAASSATDAEASLDAFNNHNMGDLASAPTTKTNGDPLEYGDQYFDTTVSQMKVYSASGWISMGSTVNGTADRYKYVASASQTTFSGSDANGNTLAYDAGYIDVYLNGVHLDPTDYTASSGTSIVLASGAALNDELYIVAYGTFVLNSTVIGDLNNVTITSVADNEVLAYDSGTSKWINQTAAEAGLATTSDIANSSNWNTAYGWGDHSAAGYATTSQIANSSNWDTAYGWGDHASAGYLDGADIGVSVQAYDVDTLKADTADTITAPMRGTVTTDNDGSFDMNVTNNFSCTPAGSFTLTFTNITSGQTGQVLLINSGGYTVSAAATTKVSATALATISTAGTYLLTYFSNGTNVYVVNSGALA